MSKKTFKTPKGTELELMDIKGKDYLQVQQRIIWFLEENPFFDIKTEFKVLTASEAICVATIKVLGAIDADMAVTKRSSTATKHETKIGFSDFAEKAETGAIGRALANLGYGTQFAAPDFDEGDRVVDSPKTPPQPTSRNSAPSQASPLRSYNPTLLKDKNIPMFKKYAGKTYGSVALDELLRSVSWLEEQAHKENKVMSQMARGFCDDVKLLQLEHDVSGTVIPEFGREQDDSEIPF